MSMCLHGNVQCGKNSIYISVKRLLIVCGLFSRYKELNGNDLFMSEEPFIFDVNVLL